MVLLAPERSRSTALVVLDGPLHWQIRGQLHWLLHGARAVIETRMFAVVAAAVLPVLVTGDLDCPSPEQVERELATLLPNERVPAPDRATLRRRRGELVVELRSPSGELLAERALPVGECAALAREVAVLIGAWETSQHPELRSPQRKPAARPAQPTAPRRPAVPSPNRRPAPTNRAPLPQEKTRRWEFDGSASLAADLGGGLAPQGSLMLALASAAGPGAALFGSVVARRNEPLEDGELQWGRVALGAAALHRVRLSEALRLEPFAGVWLARLDVTARIGNGRADGGWEPGLAGGLRLRFGRSLGATLELGGALLPRAPVAVTASGARAALPTSTLWLGVGVSFCASC